MGTSFRQRLGLECRLNLLRTWSFIITPFPQNYIRLVYLHNEPYTFQGEIYRGPWVVHKLRGMAFLITAYITSVSAYTFYHNKCPTIAASLTISSL
jgi:hypothetical protein